MTEDRTFQLTFPAVFNYTLPILSKDESGRDQIGAGVLVQIADKLLVATAKHCIRDSPAVLPDDFTIPSKANRIPIVRSVLHPTLDIGFLELRNTGEVAEINRGNASLAQLTVADLPVRGVVHVVGFPVYARRFVGRDFLCEKTGFQSQVTKQDESHYYLDYPAEGYERDYARQELRKVEMKTPHGFSGGGLWAFLLSGPNELFNPEKHIQLFGIQSAFLPERLVRCVRIGHWLSLIHDIYPELRDMLLRNFPTWAT